MVSAGVTTRFLYDGADMIAEYDASNALLRRYVHGPGMDEPLVWCEGAGTSDRRYLITDQLGSVVAANGATTTLYTYDEYGQPNAWSGARFRYTGQMMVPEAQLCHYKARAYLPALVSIPLEVVSWRNDIGVDKTEGSQSYPWICPPLNCRQGGRHRRCSLRDEGFGIQSQ